MITSLNDILGLLCKNHLKNTKNKKKLTCFYISPADAGLDLDLWYIENILTDYDSQHLQTSEPS